MFSHITSITDTIRTVAGDVFFSSKTYGTTITNGIPTFTDNSVQYTTFATPAAPVPEPSTYLLMLVGAALVLTVANKKHNS
jgi:hypothetical protein